MHTPWDHRYAQRVQRMKSSVIRELLKVTEQRDIISFAGGLPAPEVFPVEKVAAAAQRVLQNSGAQALQYSSSEGYRPLRELIASRLSQDGLNITVDHVMITSGSQQGLDLLAKILIDPGDRILVESPTYMGVFMSCNPYEPEYITVPSDEQGMITSALEEALQAGPKFIYALPNFQNPTGITFSLQRRQELVEIASRYEIPIVEDDPYSQLRFEGEPLPSLLQLEAQNQPGGPYQGNVILLNTFSKILAPGLRVGWVVATPEVIRKLVLAKQGADLHTSTLTQMIAYEIMREGFIEEHIPLIRQTYRQRRDTMLAALEEYFPQEVHWTQPQGGMFLWITLPEYMDAKALLADVLEHKVTFVPGTSFHADGGGHNTLRLSFSNASPEKINTGIARLGRLLHKKLEQA